MPRIVKADAEYVNIQTTTLHPDGSTTKGVEVGYYKSDTIEIKKGWRPEDHNNP